MSNNAINITGCKVRYIELIQRSETRFIAQINTYEVHEFTSQNDMLKFANEWFAKERKIKNQLVRINNYIKNGHVCYYNNKRGQAGATRWNADGVGLDLIFTPDAPVAAN